MGDRKQENNHSILSLLYPNPFVYMYLLKLFELAQNFWVTTLIVKDELINLTRAWGKEISESPKGIEPNLNCPCQVCASKSVSYSFSLGTFLLSQYVCKGAMHESKSTCICIGSPHARIEKASSHNILRNTLGNDFDCNIK